MAQHLFNIPDMTNDQTLKEAIEAWIAQYKYRDKFYEGKIINLWDSIVGVMISRETEQLYIKNKVLFVKLKSPALKFELEYAKTKLIKSLNKKADHEVITDIIFL